MVGWWFSLCNPRCLLHHTSANHFPSASLVLLFPPVASDSEGIAPPGAAAVSLKESQSDATAARIKPLKSPHGNAVMLHGETIASRKEMIPTGTGSGVAGNILPLKSRPHVVSPQFLLTGASGAVENKTLSDDDITGTSATANTHSAVTTEKRTSGIIGNVPTGIKPGSRLPILALAALFLSTNMNKVYIHLDICASLASSPRTINFSPCLDGHNCIRCSLGLLYGSVVRSSSTTRRQTYL